VGVEENIEQQKALYGEPLGVLVHRAAQPLGLSQAATARLLGLSPAMLSHLVNGQRVKIANPAALSRLQALIELSRVAPSLTPPERQDRLAAIGALSADLTTSQQQRPADPDTRVVRRLLRAVASGRELERAATTLADVAPGVAEVLRVYGTGSEEDMQAHLASVRHLLD